MHGHSFVNEVQTVAQIFFGFEKVEVLEMKVMDPVHTCGFHLLTLINDTAALVVVFENGAEVSRCSFLLGDTAFVNAGLSARRVLMLAMFRALQDVVPVEAPWGALTGIRPSKMVRGWLDEGKSDTEILQIMTDTLYARGDKAQLAVDVAHAERRLTTQIWAGAGTPIAIYIGIPFCPSRCLYCSFNMAHRPPTQDELEAYTATLVAEMREKAAGLRTLGGRVSSIYIGGGTPTVLPDDLLTRLLNAAGENFAPSNAVEYTVEAGRPDTLTPKNLRILRNHGVNRIAVNPQTLNDRTLTAIGRNHTAADFFRAFQEAREAGFPCMSADLITGLPNETVDDLTRSLELLLPLKPENLTIHALSVKRASQLNAARRLNDSVPLENPSLGGDYAPYYLYRQKNTIGLLENVGYSLAGFECLYNIGMMSEVQTVLGIGAGAVSKYVTGEKISRKFNEKNPEVYVARRKNRNRRLHKADG